MASRGVLATLLVLSLATQVYGTVLITTIKLPYPVLIYLLFWFIIGIASNISGLISIVLYYMENDEHHNFLSYLYFLSWLDNVLGYGGFVTGFWLLAFPSNWVHLNILIPLIPIWFWIQKDGDSMANSTIYVSGILLISNMIASLYAGNNWGLLGTLMMGVNAFLLQYPTRNTLFGLSSREGLLMGMGVASILFALSVKGSVFGPMKLASLIHWANSEIDSLS